MYLNNSGEIQGRPIGLTVGDNRVDILRDRRDHRRHSTKPIKCGSLHQLLSQSNIFDYAVKGERHIETLERRRLTEYEAHQFAVVVSATRKQQFHVV